MYGLEPIRSGTVAKRDALAYITSRGEHEIVVRPDGVTLDPA
jgi:hypothetical protein